MKITEYIEDLIESTNPGNTKDKVRAILIKRGVKEKEAEDLIAKNFDWVVKSYSDIKNSPAKIAEKLMLD